MYRKVRNIKNTVNISRIWKKCVTTLKGIPVIGLETQSFSATRAISRHEYETSANNPESPENRKWIRKLTEKKNLLAFWKGGTMDLVNYWSMDFVFHKSKILEWIKCMLCEHLWEEVVMTKGWRVDMENIYFRWASCVCITGC